jgi:hypothetical protein
MLSSLKAVNEMREELLNYQRDFYKNAQAEAAKDPIKAFVIGSSKDKIKPFLFAEMALRQNIDVYKPTSSITLNGKTFEPANSYIIPMNQQQYKLLHGMFDKQLKFKDSLFYDISSWTLPLAFGLDFEEIKTPPALGEKIQKIDQPIGELKGKGDYAYVFESHGYYTPRAIYRLLHNHVRIKVSTETFSGNGKKFDRGTIIIPVDNQERTPDQIAVYIKEITERDGLDVHALETGLDYTGVSLGSGSFLTLKKPEIAMLVEGGISATDAGEIWHLLDTRFQIPVTLLPVSVFNNANLNKYTTIIVPEGSYTAITDVAKEKLKSWVQNGGVLIGFENAVSWFNTSGFAKFELKKEDEKKDPAKPRRYADIDEYRGAQETSGAIFEADADLTNPLLFGYTSSKIPLFKPNNIFLTKANGAYSNPLVYGSNPLVTGYISKHNYDKLKNSSCLGVSVLGRGRVIGFTENLSFRAFWFGTNKLVMNAIFYGGLIASDAGR